MNKIVFKYYRNKKQFKFDMKRMIRKGYIDINHINFVDEQGELLQVEYGR